MHQNDKQGSAIKSFFTSKRYIDYTFAIPALLFIALFMFYPIVYNIVMSFKNVTIQNLVQGPQNFVGLQNFRTILSNKYFWLSFKNTFIFLFVCLFFQFSIGFLFALFYNRKFRGAKWMRAIVLVAWMNPIIITGTIYKWLMAGDNGIFNFILTTIGLDPINFLANPSTALGSVIFANIWVGIPFNMIILLSGLQGIAGELYESASIDGAGALRKFTHITFPVLRPTIMVLLLLGFIYTFKVFDIIYAMTSGGPANSSQILPYYSYELSFKMFQFGQGAAVSSVSFVIIGIFATLYVWITRKEEA